MAFELLGTNKKTGTATAYGPWPESEDPIQAAAFLSFAQGFICGHASAFDPAITAEDLEFEVSRVPEPNNVIGSIVAEASASVVHADGSTD